MTNTSSCKRGKLERRWGSSGRRGREEGRQERLKETAPDILNFNHKLEIKIMDQELGTRR